MIRFGDPVITDRDLEAVTSVLRSGWLSMNKITKQFEEEVADFLGVRYTVAASSGSSALDIAFQVLEIQSGDEVILPAITYFAPVASAARAKAKIVLADIDQTTGTIDPEDVKRKITSNTRLIVTVDYAGISANYERLREISRGIPILEDGAEALGGTYCNKRLPTLGDVGILSFHSIKQVTCGEGGMVVTNNSRFVDHARVVRNQGELGEKYHHIRIGNNYRMPEYVAALGRSQFARIKVKIYHRKMLEQTYSSLLPATMKLSYRHCDPCLFFYPVLVQSECRDKVVQALNKMNIETRLAFKPVYLQPAFRSYSSQNLSLDGSKFPGADSFWSRIIALPLHERIMKKDVEVIVETIMSAISGEVKI